MSSLPLGTEDPIVEIEHLFAVRYLTLAGFTVLLYDIFLTFGDEVTVVWGSGHWTVVKVAYLLNRYGACFLAMFYLSFLMPVFNGSDGWIAGSVDMVLDVTIETIGNGIVLYELICLWGTNKRVACLMAAGFIILHSATVVSLGIAVVQLRKNLHFFRLNNVVRTCYATVNPPAFKGVYIPAVALDVYAFILLLLNALSRPRSSSQKLLDLLWSDGAIFFFSSQLVLSSLTDGIIAMRAMCLIINVAAPPSLSVLGLSFASAMVATAVSRLYLRLNVSSMRKDLELSVYGSIYANEMLLEESELQERRVKLQG
ncbi:hypothetical protein ACEPAH_5 [Sanghuangporus vaninii]